MARGKTLLARLVVAGALVWAAEADSAVEVVAPSTSAGCLESGGDDGSCDPGDVADVALLQSRQQAKLQNVSQSKVQNVSQAKVQKASQAKVPNRATLNATAADCADECCGGTDCWSLHQASGQGPWCPLSTTNARESATTQGAGDKGWDPCIYWGGDIFAATFDGTNWFDAEGQQWLGYVYDNCPCNEGDAHCVWKFNGGTSQMEWNKAMCIGDGAVSGYMDWTWMLSQCDSGREICDDGYITAPTGPGTCLPNYYSQQDNWNLEECVPCPDWNCS